MATVKWKAAKPKVQGNIPLDIHDKFAEYKASRDLSESKALAEILTRFFQDPGAYPEIGSNHPSDNPKPCVGLSEVMERLKSLTPSSVGDNLSLEEDSHSPGIKDLSQKLELSLTRIDLMFELFSAFTQDQKRQQQQSIQKALEAQATSAENIKSDQAEMPEPDFVPEQKIYQIEMPEFELPQQKIYQFEMPELHGALAPQTYQFEMPELHGAPAPDQEQVYPVEMEVPYVGGAGQQDPHMIPLNLRRREEEVVEIEI